MKTSKLTASVLCGLLICGIHVAVSANTTQMANQSTSGESTVPTTLANTKITASVKTSQSQTSPMASAAKSTTNGSQNGSISNFTKPAVSTGTTEITTDDTRTTITTDATHVSITVPKAGSSTNTKANNTGSDSKTSSPVISPSLIKVIQQVAAMVPGFKDMMNGGFGLNNSQLKIVNDFVQMLMKSTNTNPSSLMDVLESIQSSGLFQSVVRRLGFGAKNSTVSKEATMVCDAITMLNPNRNVTLGEFMMQINMSQFMDDVKEWKNTTLRDVNAWCESLNSDTGAGVYIPPGMVHSVYNWKKCQNDVMRTLQGIIAADEQWALQMLDASAKPGSSILEGNLKFMGNYKQCQDVYHLDPATLSNIEGNICRAYIKIPQLTQIPSLMPGNPQLQWDLCLPKSCLESDLQLALIEKNLSQNLWIMCTKDLDIRDDGTAIFAIAILILFGILLVAGTIMEFCITHNDRQPVGNTRYPFTGNGHVVAGYPNGEINKSFEHNEKQGSTSFTAPNGKAAMVELDPSGFENQMNPEIPLNGKVDKRIDCNGKQEVSHDKAERENRGSCEKNKVDIGSLPRWQRALLAFSIPRNTEKILSVKSSPGTIGCLHGIRVLSMGWVILGHVIVFGLTGAAYQNPKALFELVTTMGFQLILNAPLSVDTFFLMSGTLTCYLFLKTLGKKKHITIKEFILYYVHRYWRLTPSLIIWIMIVACLMQYIGEGRPAWSDYGGAEVCRNNWWVNILYINNVYKQEEVCVGVTWFLAHDMQFYIIAPLAMIPWVYGKTLGVLLGFMASFVFIGIHVASTIWLEIKYNADLIRNQDKYSPEIYFKPYSRVAPFAIGLMLGWILWKTKCKVQMNKCLVFLGWIVSLGLILTLTLVTYDENKDLPEDTWTKTGRVVFETFYRPLWALAMSWLVFACATGYGGYINSILSWEGWLPLSRLTYSAFLIHLTIIGFENMGMEFTTLFTLTTVSYQFIGYFVMAYALGYILTVAVESPMLALEKVVLG